METVITLATSTLSTSTIFKINAGTPWYLELLGTLVSGLVVGIVLWAVGYTTEKRKVKSDAIRDLMTYRGDFASPEFRRSLNKISIIFHNKKEIRDAVRHLYDVINNPSNKSEYTKRAIVGLIYKLCQDNRFKGLTEYDIDQSFAENKQTPIEESPVPVSPVQGTSVSPETEKIEKSINSSVEKEVDA